MKDVADAFAEALKEEQPMLAEEKKTEGLLHKSVVKEPVPPLILMLVAQIAAAN